NLEDIGAMRMLPHMHVLVPLVADDVSRAVAQMLQHNEPYYLRLNLGAVFSFPVPPFTQWRHLKAGIQATVIGTGPVMQHIVNAFDFLDFWCVSEFPIESVPDELLESIHQTGKIIFVEEHYGQCGLREAISFAILDKLRIPVKILSLCAAGYPSGKYGSQLWHQEESCLAGDSMIQKVEAFIR
ncbi:MAG: hypothetical protein NZ522_06740, partial [Chitinophagales bacterium]|nr:hypothetical protein [Chitinophagales bacterium]